MNKKNTVLIAVLINAGLLAVLLVAALTTQEETIPSQQIMAEAPLILPKFDEAPLYRELPSNPELVKPVEVPLVLAEPEPVLHKLPPLAIGSPIPVAATNEIAVKKGDSLEKIAKLHHISVDEIIKLNHLPSSFLKVGQVLKIPTGNEKKSAEKGPEYYTVKVGDNPWAIAMKHHMKVEELLRLNALNEERARKLKAGDRLRIR